MLGFSNDESDFTCFKTLIGVWYFICIWLSLTIEVFLFVIRVFVISGCLILTGKTDELKI